MSRTVLVELFVQSDDTLVFVLRADRETPRLERLAIGGEALLDWAKRLLGNVTGPEGAGNGLGVDQTPFEPLVSAIEQDTDRDDVVCFVPHGSLHLVPLHAIEVAGSPLVRRNPIVYAPSASVLASISERELPAGRRGAIVVGDTRGDLPYAGVEAELVAGILDVDAIPGRQATRLRLVDAIAAARDLRVLHLACHGSFNAEDALASGILTAVADGASEEAAVLSAQDLLEVKMAADLVALSACESGISEQRQGDELVGLTRALLVAGAQSVLASRWKVNDLSTSVLMQTFYEGWVKNRLPKAEALRRAQCRVMDLTASELSDAAHSRLAGVSTRDFGGVAGPDTGTPSSDPGVALFAAPRHWAAFTLVGDWR
jgi:CHAT domain-containing protein